MSLPDSSQDERSGISPQEPQHCLSWASGSAKSNDHNNTEYFINFRRDLHQHPELGYAEHRTSARIAEELDRLGFVVHQGIAGTGVIGSLSQGTRNKSIGLRADMDALPIQESSGLGYASRHPGKMHACGHDGHVATLMAAADLISQRRNFDGTVHLIFQPAEEVGIGSGAIRMIEEGLFNRFPCDAVFGMHNMPGIPQGKMLFLSGPAMASSDVAYITVKGVGGHGASPHRANDPVVCAAQLVVALQSIVARNVDPQDVAVITIGTLRADSDAVNVIPQEVNLGISIRAFTTDVRDLVEGRIKSIASGLATSYGLTIAVAYKRGYPPVVNNPEMVLFARDVAEDLMGPNGAVLNVKPFTASEDFAFMLQERPGCYFFIGNGSVDDDGNMAPPCALHNPAYDFDDRNIAIGRDYWVRLVERFLPA